MRADLDASMRLEFLDLPAHLGQLLLQLLDLEPGELGEAHVEHRFGLPLGELEARCSCALACGVSSAARMTLITSSMLSTQILRPSRMCSRSFALSRSNCVRRTMTSWRCAM
jgi:hypothetical protein